MDVLRLICLLCGVLNGVYSLKLLKAWKLNICFSSRVQKTLTWNASLQSTHYSNKYECLLNQVYTSEAPLPHLRYLPAMEAVSCYIASLFPESDVPVLPVASSEKSLLEDDV